jgi:uncharacterized membrane protein
MLDPLSRVLLTLVLALLLVGFGWCGAYGTFYGLGGVFSGSFYGMALFMVVSGALGLLIAWRCGRSIIRLWRPRPRPEE